MTDALPLPVSSRLEPSPASGDPYWEGFYRKLPSLPVPSPFARHVAAMLHGPVALLDLGCGDGRDAAFFASLGHRVLGLDASANAIGLARSRGVPAQFEAVPLARWRPFIEGHLRAAPDALVYARFFLHAISAPDEALLLRDLADVVTPGGRLALEYRTLADAALPKLHPPHFRRFIDHAALQAELRELGFAALEAVEGQGLSPVSGEDPMLGRIMARRA
jgi:SAM-dependent methyltransferase